MNAQNQTVSKVLLEELENERESRLQQVFSQKQRGE